MRRIARLRCERLKERLGAEDVDGHDQVFQGWEGKDGGGESEGSALNEVIFKSGEGGGDGCEEDGEIIRRLDVGVSKDKVGERASGGSDKAGAELSG